MFLEFMANMLNKQVETSYLYSVIQDVGHSRLRKMTQIIRQTMSILNITKKKSGFHRMQRTLV